MLLFLYFWYIHVYPFGICLFLLIFDFCLSCIADAIPHEHMIPHEHSYDYRLILCQNAAKHIKFSGEEINEHAIFRYPISIYCSLVIIRFLNIQHDSVYIYLQSVHPFFSLSIHLSIYLSINLLIYC